MHSSTVFENSDDKRVWMRSSDAPYMWSTLATTLHFTVRNEQVLRYAASVKQGRYSGSLAFIGIIPFILDHCGLHTNAYSARDMFYIQSMKNTRLSFCVLPECLLEEETSAAAARRLCTLPKKCSVRERAGISPVFCAVSIKGSKVIWKCRVFGVRTEKTSC